MADNMTITLLPWEAKLLLESIAELEAKWTHINATSQDENEVADIANDLLQLNIAKRHLTEEAVKAFGDWVLNFDRTPIS
jgi:hypothetical protein